MTILIIASVIYLIYSHDEFIADIINQWEEGAGND